MAELGEVRNRDGVAYRARIQLELVVFEDQSIPWAIALVEEVPMAELKNHLLTAWHDLEVT